MTLGSDFRLGGEAGKPKMLGDVWMGWMYFAHDKDMNLEGCKMWIVADCVPQKDILKS